MESVDRNIDDNLESASISSNTPLKNNNNDNTWMLNLNQFRSHKKSTKEMKEYPKKIKSYYKKTNKTIEEYERYEEVNTIKSADEKLAAEEAEEKHKWLVSLAINISMIANICLFGLNVYNAIRSHSYAVFAAAVDSFLDLLAGFIIFMTAYITRHPNPLKYPAGKSRFEPLGIIVFSASMLAATVEIIVESATDLLSKSHSNPKVDKLTFILIGISIGVKFVLWLFCRSIPKSESVRTLAKDHRNDVVLNSSGVAFVLIAYYVRIKGKHLWWVDPAGAIIIAIYITLNWAKNGWEQIKLLSGRSASPQILSAITYLCWNHDSKIKQIDTVRAFHLAAGLIVEVDIVLRADMTLHEAHDIGESLQFKLERLEEVERAFVHLDYETTHVPEH